MGGEARGGAVTYTSDVEHAGRARLSRRRAIGLLLGASAAYPLSRFMAPAPGSASTATFAHGVASGDPTHDSIVLWTRVSGMTSPQRVQWTLYEQLGEAIRSGIATADPDHDFTVHIPLDDLAADTGYSYDFAVDGVRSRQGYTRTLPAPSSARPIRFAVASCSSHAAGHFNAYAGIVRDTPHFVLHLGDYIYESANASVRTPDPPRECVTLADYRARYAQYALDPDLQTARAWLPWITVWDDHEFANDAWSGGASGHQASEGPWAGRRAAAARAWQEWQPMRPGSIQGSRPLGAAATLTLTDTRTFRTHAATATDPLDPRSNDSTRSMLGAAQREAVLDALGRSYAEGAHWHVLANQTIFSPHRTNPSDLPLPYLPEEVVEAGIVRQGGGNSGGDNWGAFWRERDEIIGFLRQHVPTGTLILSGDAHAAWGLEVTENPFDPSGYNPLDSDGSVAVEIVCTSVTSHNLEEAAPGLAAPANAAVLAGNPNARFCDLAGHGYCLLTLNGEHASVEWIKTGPVSSRSASRSVAASGSVRSDRNRLTVWT